MAQQTGLVRQAIDWFREKFQTLRRELISGRAGRQSSGDIIGEARRDSKIQLGHMYFFNYHPKYAAKLEYYDQFYLISFYNDQLLYTYTFQPSLLQMRELMI